MYRVCFEPNGSDVRAVEVMINRDRWVLRGREPGSMEAEKALFLVRHLFLPRQHVRQSPPAEPEKDPAFLRNWSMHEHLLSGTRPPGMPADAWRPDKQVRASWVVRGKLLAGFYPGDPDPQKAGCKIDWLLKKGIRCFVNSNSRSPGTGSADATAETVRNRGPFQSNVDESLPARDVYCTQFRARRTFTKEATMSRQISSLYIIFVLLVLPTSASVSEAQAPSSTGSRIGTIIKDAIEVALPNAAKLIDAIFGKRDKADKKAAESAIDTQAAMAKRASEAKLGEISNIATELNVVCQYLELTVPASQKVARMLSRLEDASGSTMPAGIRSDWGNLDQVLQKLSDIKKPEIEKVEPGLRLRLLEIRDIYFANSSDIGASIERNDVGGLKSQLRAISSLLNSVVTIAGIEIASLQEGLDFVVKSLNNKTSQGIARSARIAAFAEAMDDDLQLAKLVLTKKPK